MTTQLQPQQIRTGSRFPPATPSFEAISPPQSQNSSFNESFSSQQLDALEKQPNSQHSSLLRNASPATSISNRSSQEITQNPGRKAVARVNTKEMHEPAVEYGTLSEQPSTSRGRPTSAPKRMLNGEIKSAGTSQLTSPLDEQNVSRRVSREIQAAELKDRLAFAKYKLDHGYQDLKLADVEAITSQQGSPVSAPADARNRSPRKPPSLQHSTSNSSRPSAYSPPYSQAHFGAPGSRSQMPASYDDFWNSQPPLRPPILAPSADLNSRPMYQAPNVHTSPTTVHPLAAPLTPQRRPRLGIRSPSEQRASEADAIEALALMSSPQNVSHYPKTPNGISGSPLRGQSQYIMTPNRPHFLQVSQESQPTTKRPMTERERDLEIDRRLDAMSDSEDDDR